MKGTAERKEHTYSEINFEKSVIYETQFDQQNQKLRKSAIWFASHVI